MQRAGWIVAVTLVLLTGPVTAIAADTAAEVQTTFQVEGMHCDGCSATIVGTLERLEGVTSATASHEHGVAEVVYHRKKVTAEELKAAIEKLGYSVTDMETVPERT